MCTPIEFDTCEDGVYSLQRGIDDELIIIDFDRYDFGAPWEEFNRIVWSAKK